MWQHSADKIFSFFSVINYSASSSMLKCPHPLCMEKPYVTFSRLIFYFKAEKCRSGDLSLFISFRHSSDDSYQAGGKKLRERPLITCRGGLECDYSGPSWEFLTLCFTKSFVLYHWSWDGVKEKKAGKDKRHYDVCVCHGTCELLYILVLHVIHKFAFRNNYLRHFTTLFLVPHAEWVDCSVS